MSPVLIVKYSSPGKAYALLQDMDDGLFGRFLDVVLDEIHRFGWWVTRSRVWVDLRRATQNWD